MNRQFPVAALVGTMFVASASYGEEINLLCKGTYYLYEGEGTPQQASTDSVTIKLDDAKRTIQIAGTLEANASGPMSIEEGHYWAVLPHANEAKGLRYPYLGVNINRTTGEAMIFSLARPSFDGSGVVYFNGKCSRSKRLF